MRALLGYLNHVNASFPSLPNTSHHNIVSGVQSALQTADRNLSSAINCNNQAKRMATQVEGPVTIPQLAVQYQQEFLDFYKTTLQLLHKASTEFYQSIVAKKEELMKAELSAENRSAIVGPLKNISPISLVDMMLLQSFAWLAVMQFGYSIGYNILSVLLRPFFCLALTDLQVFLLAYIVLPIHAYKGLSIDLDAQSRFKLLFFAIAEGITMGHLFQNQELDLPSPLTMLLGIALCAHGMAKFSSGRTSREQFLAVSLGISVAVNFGIAIILGQLTSGFVMLTLLHVLFGAVTLQFYFDHWENDYDKNPYKFMLMLIYGCDMVLAGIFMVLFG